jgi:hypothetical protein
VHESIRIRQRHFVLTMILMYTKSTKILALWINDAQNSLLIKRSTLQLDDLASLTLVNLHIKHQYPWSELHARYHHTGTHYEHHQHHTSTLSHYPTMDILAQLAEPPSPQTGFKPLSANRWDLHTALISKVKFTRLHANAILRNPTVHPHHRPHLHAHHPAIR